MRWWPIQLFMAFPPLWQLLKIPNTKCKYKYQTQIQIQNTNTKCCGGHSSSFLPSHRFDSSTKYQIQNGNTNRSWKCKFKILIQIQNINVKCAFFYCFPPLWQLHKVPTNQLMRMKIVQGLKVCSMCLKTILDKSQRHQATIICWQLSRINEDFRYDDEGPR